MHWRRNTTPGRLCDPSVMYSQLEKVLIDFVEHTNKIKESSSSFQSVSPRWKSYSKQFIILQKAKDLLGLLKEKDWKSKSSHEVELNGSQDVTLKDASFHGCSTVDMSLTLDNTNNDLNATKYLSDMEITCMESCFFKTPTATVRSILKNSQTQRKAERSERRKVRFEDELEGTLAEIIGNKENLDWESIEAVVEGNCRSVMKTNNGYDKESVTTSFCRPVSRGKTIETLKILSKQEIPRNSWGNRKEETVDLNALRKFKTQMEIDNEQRQNSKWELKMVDEAIITSAEAMTDLKPMESSLRLSLIPENLEEVGLTISWTSDRDLGLNSTIYFE